MTPEQLLWLMAALTREALLNSPGYRFSFKHGKQKKIWMEPHLKTLQKEKKKKRRNENECLTANENKILNVAPKDLKTVP